MTRDDIIRMARKADMMGLDGVPFDYLCTADLVRFATLVAAAEREACAKVCDDMFDEQTRYISATIRARSTP